MSEILDDIFDEVELKPKQSKKIVKWVIRIALALIVVSFTLGGSWVAFKKKIKKYDATVKIIKKDIRNNKSQDSISFIQTKEELRHLDNRIDDLYKKD